MLCDWTEMYWFILSLFRLRVCFIWCAQVIHDNNLFVFRAILLISFRMLNSSSSTPSLHSTAYIEIHFDFFFPVYKWIKKQNLGEIVTYNCNKVFCKMLSGIWFIFDVPANFVRPPFCIVAFIVAVCVCVFDVQQNSKFNTNYESLQRYNSHFSFLFARFWVSMHDTTCTNKNWTNKCTKCSAQSECAQNGINSYCSLLSLLHSSFAYRISTISFF